MAGIRTAPKTRAARPPRSRQADRRQRQDDDLLHVRLPLRHPRALKDGRVRYIDGNPEHPVNRGVICAKGSAGIMQHYSPARLSKPLLRVGERGNGEFREIEWDEALELATTVARRHPRTRPGRARVLHRPRPVAGADRLVGAAVRHDQLRRARRLLLGQHGRGRHVHARRQLLGIRRTRLGADAST